MILQQTAAVQTLSGFSGATYSGHSHLNGETVKVIRDDIVDADATVSSGNVTVVVPLQLI